MTLEEVVQELNRLADRRALAGMARYGIGADYALGVSIPKLRELARRIGTDDPLAEALWHRPVLERRILASMVADATKVDRDRLERWALDFTDWGLCDQVCNNLFRRVAGIRKVALAWTRRDEPYVKRAGFVLVAQMAVHRKEVGDDWFDVPLAACLREAEDPRNEVRKAVSWAMRQVGKRNLVLLDRVEPMAHRLATGGSAARRTSREVLSDLARARLRLERRKA